MMQQPQFVQRVKEQRILGKATTGLRSRGDLSYCLYTTGAFVTQNVATSVASSFGVNQKRKSG